jgi:hypothetical protein
VAGELHALLRHAVEMRRGVFGAEGADVGVAEVVDVDEDDVRAEASEGKAAENDECRMENDERSKTRDFMGREKRELRISLPLQVCDQ